MSHQISKSGALGGEVRLETGELSDFGCICCAEPWAALICLLGWSSTARPTPALITLNRRLDDSNKHNSRLSHYQDFEILMQLSLLQPTFAY
jgi:hypothetical protein